MQIKLANSVFLATDGSLVPSASSQAPVGTPRDSEEPTIKTLNGTRIKISYIENLLKAGEK